MYNYRVHTECIIHFLTNIPSWRKNKKSAQPGKRGGCTPTSFYYTYHHVQSYAPAERADTLLLFLLYPYMYSVCITLQKVWGELRKKFDHKRDCRSDKREAEKQD